MKNHYHYPFMILAAVMLLLSTPTLAQKKAVLKELFYRLPVNASGNQLVKLLARDSNLIKSDKQSPNAEGQGFFYEGRIRAGSQPQTALAERAVISLTPNTGYDIDSKKDIKSSDITISYLFKDEKAAEQFFNTTWNKIKAFAKDSSDAQFGMSTDEDYSYGKSASLHQRKRLPEIYLLKKDSDGQQYVYLIYRREGY